MKCPFCGSEDLKVNDTRTRGNIIRRKRQCLSCQNTFFSIEMIDLSEIMVQKRKGNIEAFDRSKILTGLKRAFNKIDITQDDIIKILDNIEMEIYRKKTNVIASEDVGEIVLKYLKVVNDIAYIRFLSVYRGFKNLEEFYLEIAKLREERKRS